MGAATFRPDLGRVGGELAEALAWLNSPATIAGEIARLEAAQQQGDHTDATRAQLADWRAVERAQRRMMGGTVQEALPLAATAY